MESGQANGFDASPKAASDSTVGDLKHALNDMEDIFVPGPVLPNKRRFFGIEHSVQYISSQGQIIDVAEGPHEGCGNQIERKEEVGESGRKFCLLDRPHAPVDTQATKQVKHVGRDEDHLGVLETRTQSVELFAELTSLLLVEIRRCGRKFVVQRLFVRWHAGHNSSACSALALSFSRSFLRFVARYLKLLPLLTGALVWVTGCGGIAASTRPDQDEMEEIDDKDPPEMEMGIGGSPVVLPTTGGAPSEEPDPSSECVVDEQRGLMWEVKSEDPTDFRYAGFTYSWYVSALEEATRGAENNGVCAFPPCNTEKYIEGLNLLSLCGYSDWRLPDLDELLSLAVLEGSEMMGTPTGEEPFYWSISQTDEAEAAWGAYLCCGGVPAPGKKTGAGFVRAVRGAQ